jgi:hypothetical protein
MPRRSPFQAIANAFGRFVASPQADLVAVLLVVHAGAFLIISAYQAVSDARGIA